jgi:hypothetical protein
MVGITTGYGLDDRRVVDRVPVGLNFHFSLSSGPAVESTQPLSNGCKGIFPRGEKRQGRDVDHSFRSSAEVKKTWCYTSTPPYVIMA